MKNEHLKLGCVVLAAGKASRFGSNKLLSALEGRSLILRTLETVPTEVFDAVTVVTRFPEVLRLAEEFHFAAVLNDRPELGLSRSVQLGLTGLRDCGGVCFLVSDQPLLRRESVARLAELWRSRPERIAALGHGGQHGLRCGGRGVNGVRQHRSRRFGHRGGGLCQRQGGKRRGKRQKAEHHRPAECFPQGADPPCNLRRAVVQ